MSAVLRSSNLASQQWLKVLCQTRGPLRGGLALGNPATRRVTPSGTRSLSFVRKVSFPPTDKAPYLSLFFASFIFSGLYTNARMLREMDAAEWVRQASSETWGKRRVLDALYKMLQSLTWNFGSGWLGWLNAAPILLSKDVVGKVILPGLKSEDEEIVDANAELLVGLLSQRTAKKKVCNDSRVFHAVLDAMESWISVECADCDRPVPALESLTAAFRLCFRPYLESLHLPQETGKNEELQRVIRLVTELARKVEKGHKSSFTNQSDLDDIAPLFDRAMRRGKHLAVMVEHRRNWYIDVGGNLVEICEELSRKCPESRQELIPAFCSLSHALAQVNLSLLRSMDDLEFIDAIDSTMYSLGVQLHESVKVEDGMPSGLELKDWRFFQMTNTLFQEAESSLYTRVIYGLDKLERKLESLFHIAHGGMVGFFWGALRTTIALRNVENPMSLQPYTAGGMPYAPPYGGQQYYPPQPGPQGVPSPHGGYPGMSAPSHMGGNQGSFVPRDGPVFHPHESPVSPRWRTELILKHARLAAVGTMVMVTVNELSDLFGHYLWVEDPTWQVVIAIPKVCLDVALFWGVLRSAPYTFLPTMVSTSVPEEDTILLPW